MVEIRSQLKLCLLTLLLLTSLVAAAPQNLSAIKGTIIRAGGSDAIGGVLVTLVSAETRRQYTVMADSQGQYGFDGVPPGRYTLRAEREGFFTAPDNLPLPRQIDFFTITTPETHFVVTELIPGAVIAGRITDSNGEPLPDVGVSAVRLQYDEGRRAFDAGTVPKPTNDQGEYRLYSLPPGEYYVRATYAKADTLARKSFYPGTVDSLGAAPLTVRGGETYEGINFSLPPGQSVRISGKVEFDDEGPAGGVVRTFYLLPTDGRPSEVYPQEFVNTVQPQLGIISPEFVIEARGVAPGSYDLAPFYIDRGTAYHTGRTPIEIRDQDIQNFSTAIHPNVEVTGRIVIRGLDTFRSWTSLHLQLRSKDVAVPLTSRSNVASVADDGSFSIRNVIEGTYQLHLGAAHGSIPEGFYISEMRQGARDIRESGTVEVRAGVEPLEIVLSVGAGRMHGIVESATGGPPLQANVVLVPQFSRRRNAMFYDRVGIDDNGEFSFEEIAPGEYKVFAFEQLADTAERNPEFLARYESLGSAVYINAGANAEIRLRLIR